MKLRDAYQYAMVIPTSMGIRITPDTRQPVHASSSFLMQVTSAEANVASVSSYLGLPVKVLTKFVKDSPISRMIRQDLRSRGIQYEGLEVDQGGPWGYRHQFNIADSGFGARGPRVHNDRAGEVGRTLQTSDFDLERIFVKEGARLLHMSGLICALSPETSRFCVDLAKKAKENGTVISFDLNYRASFWKNREQELREVFTEIAALADILIGNEEDFQLALGLRGPDAGGHELSDKIEAFKEMMTRTKAAFPNASVFATTLRQVISANEHLWGAILLEGDNWHAVEPRPIPVLDRIGGGDGFVGGLLYSILREWPAEKWVQFGWATGALATTMLTDHAQPADEDEVWNIYRGNARVKR